MNPIAHSPHAHAPVSIGKVMGTVMLALTPATFFGFWLYGWPAINLWAVSLIAAIVGEAFAVRLQGRAVRPALMDGSGILTAWLLAISLPPFAPWWIAVLGSLFAVVIGKQVFGGLGQNVFNPAMAARVMLLISFPLEMTTWVAPAPFGSAHAPGLLESLRITFLSQPLDGMASASLLGHVKTEFTRGIGLEQALTGYYSPMDMLWGSRAGSLGETAAVLLLAGGLFLIARRIITWHAPVAMLLGVAVPALLFNTIDGNHYAGPMYHLLSGGLMLAAFFIVTDPVTSPNTALGQFIFGLGCGLLTWIIRTWGGYPEGVAFAVMIMNTVSPLIDQYVKPRIYGRDRKGAAMPVKKEA
ncbi:electron transport complex subunit RnfD [Ferrigenium kumadai]|uniref:Ion-translocating oxidoreductase complex subunit D n=1 Tax=Ferrigenium kumadai TaxID=1682490 RepID=A0AAN1SYJ9_9PROT|nr:RnfABCDGE type electron transport complex subunit D [Ferrigenium kumadai]BBI99368.1 electron transport complex subunit RnfD [Ferrigenium kumadai]